MHLAVVSLLEQISGKIQQHDFYLLMFLLHSGLMVNIPAPLLTLARMNHFWRKPPDQRDATA